MKEQYNYEQRLEELENKKDVTFQKILEPFIYESVENYIESNKEDIQVLDVGCGCGFLTNQIANKFSDIEIEGIDFSDEAIKCAEKHFNLKFIKGDITTFNTNKKYDILVYNMVLHNLEEIPFSMKKNHEILKQDGIVIITIPHPTFWLQDKINRGKITLEGPFNYKEEKIYKIPFKIKNGFYHHNYLNYYHRCLATYINTCSKYFKILNFEETDYKNGLPTMLNIVLQK